MVENEQPVQRAVSYAALSTQPPVRTPEELTSLQQAYSQQAARELAARLTGWDCVWVRAGQEADALKAARRRKSLIIVVGADSQAVGA